MTTLRYETDVNAASAARQAAARNRIAGYMGMTDEHAALIQRLRGGAQTLDSLLLAMDAAESVERGDARAPVRNPLEASPAMAAMVRRIA